MGDLMKALYIICVIIVICVLYKLYKGLIEANKKIDNLNKEIEDIHSGRKETHNDIEKKEELKTKIKNDSLNLNDKF